MVPHQCCCLLHFFFFFFLCPFSSSFDSYFIFSLCNSGKSFVNFSLLFLFLSLSFSFKIYLLFSWYLFCFSAFESFFSPAGFLLILLACNTISSTQILFSFTCSICSRGDYVAPSLLLPRNDLVGQKTRKIGKCSSTHELKYFRINIWKLKGWITKACFRLIWMVQMFIISKLKFSFLANLNTFWNSDISGGHYWRIHICYLV